MAEELEDEAGTEEHRPRAFWSGVITFGLVSIPVELYSANRPRDISLRMLDAQGNPLRRRYICPGDRRPLSNDELVRGFETEEGEVVVIADEELEALEPKKSREIDLTSFVDRAEIDPMYLLRTYFLLPAGETSKAYRLLADTMERTGRAGIASFILRGKEHLVAIVAENGILRADTLRYHDEVKDVGEIELPAGKKPPREAVQRLERAIEARRSEELPLGYLRDDYGQKLHALARKKLAGREGIVPMSREVAEEQRGEVVDIMQVLMQKLGVQARPAEVQKVRKPSASARRRKKGKRRAG